MKHLVQIALAMGAIGAALTVSLRQGSALIAIIVLPLCVPVLILATEMIRTAGANGDYWGHMLWLGALLFFALGIAPLAASAAVKMAVSE